MKLVFFNLFESPLYAVMLSCQFCFDLSVLNKTVFSFRRDGVDVKMLLLLQSTLRYADARLGAGGQYIPF